MKYYIVAKPDIDDKSICVGFCLMMLDPLITIMQCLPKNISEEILFKEKHCSKRPHLPIRQMWPFTAKERLKSKYR